jgi:adenylate kinase family enzyme
VIVVPAVVIALLLGLQRPFGKVRSNFRQDAVQRLGGGSYRRWVVGGMMGSGKTTFARSLSASLGLPHIEVDHFPSEDDLARRVSACSTGWVVEANPWQIPPRVAAQGEAIVFLDYDNAVNYVRLLKRGWVEWKRQGFSVAGFKASIIDKALLDLGRIVYRYGKSNRQQWREKGLFPNVDGSTVAYIRCESPAELSIVESLVIATGSHSGSGSAVPPVGRVTA